MLNHSISYFHILSGIVKGAPRIPRLLLKKLLLIQNKAVRAICLLNWCEHVAPCFDRISILQIKDVSKLESAKFVHKPVKSLPL